MPQMTNERWSSADEATLRELVGKGFNLRKLALRLRRSECSVKKRAFLLDIKVAPPRRSRFRFT